MGEGAKPTWATEAAMVADFVAWVSRQGVGNRNRPDEPWTVYAETCGWDLVLVRADGFQIGVEAKLSLNAKVLCQALAHDRYARAGTGPDCHAVLVPAAKAVNGLDLIAARLGITVICASPARDTPYLRTSGRPTFRPDLPGRKEHLYDWHDPRWYERCPDHRLKLPDYVPDVEGGHPSPVALTNWKVAALKAAIILETRGRLTRADFKHLSLSPTRWTQFWLRSDGAGGWLATEALPDFKSQHPVNYEQIRADAAKWMPPAQPTQQSLLGAA